MTIAMSQFNYASSRSAVFTLGAEARRVDLYAPYHGLAILFEELPQRDGMPHQRFLIDGGVR
jgi:hypothetical protein